MLEMDQLIDTDQEGSWRSVGFFVGVRSIASIGVGQHPPRTRPSAFPCVRIPCMVTRKTATPETGNQLRVRVHLVDSEPEIWRLFEIDGSLTLDRVHSALQIIMGWEESHLHEFIDTNPDTLGRKIPTEPRRWGSAFLRDDDVEDIYLPEETTTIQEVLTEQAPLFYIYDLGDRWLHQLQLIETLPASSAEPTVSVIRGERRCPLEDSGGIDGYEHLLQVLQRPDDEEHDDLLDWVTSMHHNSAHPFDAEL